MKIEVKDGLSATIEPPGGLSMLWSPNGGTVMFRVGVRYVRYISYTPLALGLSAFWAVGPLVFCFLFSPPAHYP